MSDTLKSVCLLLLASCALAVAPAASLARSGEFIIQLGGQDCCNAPFDVATAPSGDIFVADKGGKVWRYNSDGEFITSWSLPGGPAVGIAVDANSVYAISAPGLPDTGPTPVYAYSHSGALKWSNSSVQSALRLAVTGTELLVAEWNQGIKRLDPATGLSVGDSFVPGANVKAISRMPNGSIYYVNYGGSAAVIDSSGAATGIEATMPAIPTNFSLPLTAANSNGQIYYAIDGDEQGTYGIDAQVQRFSPLLVGEGAPFTLRDTGLYTGLYGAMGMAISPDNSTIYIGWPSHSRVVALDLLHPLLAIDRRTTTGANAYGGAASMSEDEVLLSALADDHTQTLSDATPTTVRTGAIARIDWDLDGNGSFELVDTPASITTTFAAGLHEIKARATSTLGKSTVSELSFRTYASPPAGDVGVSINNGDEFTNDPNVKVRMVWPPGAISAKIANDGGFAGAEAFNVGRDLPWTIRSSGSEKLARTIYVRFRGDAIGNAQVERPDPTKTFQDDIILDQTDPSVISAAISGSSAVSAAAAKRSYMIRLRASDRTSGVARAQLATTKTKPLAPTAFRTRLSATSVSRPRWVRVRDHAGNWSRWRAIR
jgi:hypothetical protein